MKSPFKFLDAFALADSKCFFGRDKEVAALYKMVFQTRLIVIYGFSGTGKTSLVQCGLASKFDGPDWHPFFIRRNKNINDSLDNILNEAIHFDQDEYLVKDANGASKTHYTLPVQTKVNENSSLVKKVDYLCSEYYRPVYLIFDQLEELFILGSPEEQKEFIQSIKELVEAKLLCKIIFILREEYLGSLYGFEKEMPYIRDFQLRVEAVNNKIAGEIVNSSFKEFNIHLEKPIDISTNLIIDKMSGGQSGIQLPYLQVYLDRLYQEEFQRSYPNGSSIIRPILKVTRKEIERLGEIENVLERFLEEQKELLRISALKMFNVDEHLIDELFNLLVTDDQTKRPIYFKRVDGVLIVERHEGYKDLIPKMESEALGHCIQFLARSRIIRFLSDTYFELAHDSLAVIIDQKKTDEQREYQKIIKSIANNFNDYVSFPDRFLSPEQLMKYSPYEEQIERKDARYYDFMIKSRENIRIEKEKKEKAQREKDRSKRIIIASCSFLLFSLIAAYFFNDQRVKAIKSEARAVQSEKEVVDGDIKSRKLEYINIVQTGTIFKNQGAFDQAIFELQKAKRHADSTIAKFGSRKNIVFENPSLDSLMIKQINWKRGGEAYNKGVELLDKNKDGSSLKESLMYFKLAYDILPDENISGKIEFIENEIADKFIIWKLRAKQFIIFKQCDFATYAIMLAESLITDSNSIEQRKIINELNSDLEGIQDKCNY